MNVLVFSKSRQAIFPNRVEKESLSQSNDHISYTWGHANLFDKEIAFGITNWLSLQWSTVNFSGSICGVQMPDWCSICICSIWWGLPPGVFKGGSNICCYPPECSIFNFLSWWAGWKEVILGPAIWSSHNHISPPQTKNPVWGLCQWLNISVPVPYSGTGKWSLSVSTDLGKSRWAGQGLGPHLSPSSHTPSSHGNSDSVFNSPWKCLDISLFPV